MQKLKKNYIEKIKPQLKKEFGIKNIMAIPELKKIVVNMGIGEAIKDKKIVEEFESQLAIITGQKPRFNKARKAVSGFTLRQGQIIGLSVTLRGKRMYDFYEKLVSIVLPRLRDFQGVSLKSFDGQGNYSLGILEQTVFSEIDYSKINKVKGLEITFVTSTKDNMQAKRLLELLGMPFAKGEK
jgi:large subunit ribosomal protein L5